MKLNQLFSNRPDAGCYVIAEAGLNHNGSLAMAKSLIDLAAISGADAVKFQKRTVDQLAVREALDAPDERFPEFGQTYREIRQHLEFDMAQYQQLKTYSEAKGLDFLVTAFDTEAVDFLEELGVGGYKLASHSATNLPLLRYLAPLKKPVVLSTGMASLDELDAAVEIFSQQQTPLVLLHCVSSYPTPPEQCNLQVMSLLKARYGIPVGYSGHEIGYLPTLTAVSMGAVAVERHYTLDNRLPGFDHKMSLQADELISMVRDIRSIRTIQGEAVKEVSETEMITRRKYHVSLVSVREIPAGTVLTEDMITYRNPGTGIPAKDVGKILGQRSTQHIAADVLFETEWFEAG